MINLNLHNFLELFVIPDLVSLPVYLQVLLLPGLDGVHELALQLGHLLLLDPEDLVLLLYLVGGLLELLLVDPVELRLFVLVLLVALLEAEPEALNQLL